LATMSVGLRFSLGFDSFSGPRFAQDLAVAPGSPHAVAVTSRYNNRNPGFAELKIYDDGIARPNAASPDSGSRSVIDAIAFAATPSLLYGYDEETTGHGLIRMTIDSTGIVAADAAGGIGGAAGPIVFAGGLLYASNGQVVNPETATLAGEYDLGQANSGMWPTGGFAVDTTTNRAYFLVSDTFNTHFT